MAKKLEITPSRVYIQDGTRMVFDTMAKSFCRVPTAVLTVNPFTLSYPDFSNKTYVYLHGRQTIPGDPFDRAYEVCRTLASVGAQETSMSDVDLGALPVGTDYLETRVKLTRTTSPPNMWGSISPASTGSYPWPTEIEPGQWMQLLGNSMVIERGDNWARMFSIVIQAGRAVLKRKQTVGQYGFETGQIQFKDDIANRGAATILESNDGGHCSFVNSNNYASVYTGVLEITPCSRSIA